MDCDLPGCDLPDCADSCTSISCDSCDLFDRKKNKLDNRPTPYNDDNPLPDQDVQGLFRRTLHAASLTVLPDRPVRGWSLPRRFGAWAIRRYQRSISPRLSIRCRYTPSCSHYGLAAVRTYGLVRGSRLALGRILRCNGAVPHGTQDPFPAGARDLARTS